jgi:hypothetical protein
MSVAVNELQAVLLRHPTRKRLPLDDEREFVDPPLCRESVANAFSFLYALSM